MRRVLGATGRVLITAGALILLFVAYQLWGTGVFEARAQDDLRDDFKQDLAARPAPARPADDRRPPTTAPVPVPPAGEPVGIIRIPKIGVDKVVVEGTTVADLRKGPGHYSGTPLPGQTGNAAIAGHRTTYGAPFADLDQLVAGDVISVQTLGGTFEYEVSEVFVVNPSAVEVLDPPSKPDEAILTLTTCNPKYSASQRLIVRAEYQDPEPLPQQPPGVRRPESIDAGLSGDRSSRLPTLLWGLAAAAVGALWWLFFHRHRSRLNWFVGAVLFLPPLFVFYVFLERVLPSNY